MRFTYFKSGDFNAQCDVCGFKFKGSQLKKRWDGLMVCDEDWEQRHPQELIRPVQDQNRLPWTRPESTNAFVTRTDTHLGSVAVTAGSTSVVITDSNITTAAQVLITGKVPEDEELQIGSVVSGSGTATITFSVAPCNATTIYYVIVG